MPERFVESHIAQIPLFQNFSAAQLNLLAREFEARHFSPGETVFQQYEPTQGMHIFVSGEGLLFQSEQGEAEKRIGVIQAGQYINIQALFAEGIETATLRVTQPADTLFLSRQRLNRLLAHYPELKESFGAAESAASHARAKHFRGQREDEEVLMLTRRHWWSYLRYAWIPVLVALPFIIAIFLAPMAPILQLILSGLAFVIAVGGLFYIWLEWRNDAVIITDQRLVLVTHTLLTFTEQVSEVPIDHILEVNIDIPPLDLAARILNYGTIALKTAGQAGSAQLDFAPNPETIRRIILEDVRRNQESKSFNRNAMRADVEKWVRGDNAGEKSSDLERITHSSGERIYRKHRFVFLRGAILPALVMSGAGVFLALAFLLPSLATIQTISLPLAIFGILVGGLWFYYVYWDWKNDYYVVNDETITLVHRRPLWLQNEIDQIVMNRVDNVLAESTGIFQRAFNYGDVKIALLGADEFKVFDDVPDPFAIQADISRRQIRIKRASRSEHVDWSREMIGEYIAMYHEILQQKEGSAPFQAPVGNYDDLRTGEIPGDVPSRLSPGQSNNPFANRDLNQPPNMPRRQD